MRRNFDDPIYKDWRIKVYKRDNFCCQMPGCKAKKKGLQAHHIRKWSTAASLRYELDNGITLCRRCHDQITGQEHLYESIFMKIVRDKK